MPLRLACLDWYPGFDQGHIFVRLLARALGAAVESSSPRDADVILVGPYGNSKTLLQKRTHQIVIFGSGENARPDYRYCDLSMTLDFSTYSGRNVRVPAWAGEFDFWRDSPRSTYSWVQAQHIMALNRPINLNPSSQLEHKIAAIFSTYEQNRISVLSAIESRCGPVTKIGQLWGNAESCRDADRLFPAKHPVLANHAMNLCFENSIAPGYITEKILHARMAGCLALSFVHPTVSVDYDTKGVLNYHDFLDVEEYVEVIYKMLSSPPCLDELRSAPVFSKLPDPDLIVRNLRNSLALYLRRWV